MSSVNALRKIVARAELRRAITEEFLHGALETTALFWHAVTRQQVYLLWTAALTLTHILEVWVLIRFHYAFPPSFGLTALRLISSFSLIGLFGALAFRWTDFDAQRGGSGHTDINIKVTRLRECARFVLVLGSILSVMLACWLTGFSRLDLSSPSAFRAVVFNGVLGLPVDITAGFLLYLSSRVGAIPITRKFRWLALISTVLALVFLALDLPIIYLLFALAPRIALLRSVWTKVSGESLKSLIVPPRFYNADSSTFANMFQRRLIRGAGTQVLLDVGFLLLFNGLARFETGISLLLYLVHKCAHLGVVLVGKTHASFTTQIKAAILTGESTRLAIVTRTITMLAAFYAVVAFAFTPLFLVQRRALQWLSPTGEVFSFDLALIAVGFVLTMSYIVLSLAGAFGTYLKASKGLLVAIIFVLVSALARYGTPIFVHWLSVRETLILFGSVQSILAVLSLFGVRRALKRSERFADRDSALMSGLRGLLGKLSTAKSECDLTGATRAPVLGLFAVTVVRGNDWDPERIVKRISNLLTKDDFVAHWGATLFILVAGDSEASLYEFRIQLVKQLAGHVADLRFATCNGLCPSAVLTKLFDDDDFAQTLYQLASGRKPAVSVPEVEMIVRELMEWQATGDSRSKVAGLGAFHQSQGWNLEVIEDLELRVKARRYLKALFQRGEFLAPDTDNSREFGAFLHLNRDSYPSMIIMMPQEKREVLAGLRFEAFKLNLFDALRYSENYPKVQP